MTPAAASFLYVLLQTQQGKPAKATTAEEFGHIMQGFNAKLQALKARAGDTGQTLWSFDHAHPHDCWYDKTGDRLPPSNWCKRLEIPKHAPDFQQIIEHTWARWKSSLRNAVYTDCSSTGAAVIPLPRLRKLAVDALQASVSPAMIAADIKNLQMTLRIVGATRGRGFLLSTRTAALGTTAARGATGRPPRTGKPARRRERTPPPPAPRPRRRALSQKPCKAATTLSACIPPTHHSS